MTQPLSEPTDAFYYRVPHPNGPDWDMYLKTSWPRRRIILRFREGFSWQITALLHPQLEGDLTVIPVPIIADEYGWGRLNRMRRGLPSGLALTATMRPSWHSRLRRRLISTGFHFLR